MTLDSVFVTKESCDTVWKLLKNKAAIDVSKQFNSTIDLMLELCDYG